MILSLEREEHSLVTLTEAADALEARKDAAVSGPNKVLFDAAGTAVLEKEHAKVICIGFDLDLDEAERLADEIMVQAKRTVAFIVEGGYPVSQALDDTMCSMWLDGLFTALMLCELRKKEEAQTDG